MVVEAQTTPQGSEFNQCGNVKNISVCIFAFTHEFRLTVRPSREDGKLDFFRRLLLLITALQWNLPLEDFLKTNNASEMECGKTRFSEGKHQRVFFLLKLELVVVPQFSRK